VAMEAARPDLDFSLHRLGTTGSTLLVVGGIQGDEPGGFTAASLLVTNYTIRSGQVWVVPNLNFPSIVKRNRGSFGDMNRKFAYVDPKDPDYSAVRRIQEIICHPGVDLILNLHDGSGFYRPTREDDNRGPHRWGQCIIIDQDNLDGVSSPYEGLASMARVAVRDANSKLLKADHRYFLKNTETRKGDKEMEKTLSYYAVRKGKAAFGVEASKSFTTEYRVYYHLLVLESFMRQMGIVFERKFPLTPAGVKKAINSDVGITLYDDRLVLALDNARPSLAYVPMQKNAPVNPKGTKPLLALLKDKEIWRVAYGNRTLTRLSPQYVDYDNSLAGIELVTEGRAHTVPVGNVVTVRDAFMVKSMQGVRVNAIGARKEKTDGSECNVVLRKKDFLPQYSVDKGATMFRVEMYKGKAFAGMVLVQFGKAPTSPRETMTAVRGPESDFGF
jgi:Predicted deacylase